VNTDSPDYRAEFTASVDKEGRLVIHQREQGRWIGWLMKHAGKAITIIATREKKRRSDAQNKRYWSLIVPCFSEWSGYEKDEAHEVLLQLFSKFEDHLPSGEVVERIRRSSKMDVAQFNEYTSRVERFLAEHGFQFPDMAA